MCAICKQFDLDLNDREDGIQAQHRLMDILREAAQEHKWEFLVGPMSGPQRRWYDLNDPARQVTKKP